MKTDASEYALVGTEACDPNLFYSENPMMTDVSNKIENARARALEAISLLVLSHRVTVERIQIAACHPIFDSKNG
jgi:hypothetical protein